MVEKVTKGLVSLCYVHAKDIYRTNMQIVGQHGVWQQDCDNVVQEVSCAGMSWGQAETGRNHELALVGGAGVKAAQQRTES